MKNLFLWLLFSLVVNQACTFSGEANEEIYGKSNDFPKILDVSCKQIELPAIIEMMSWCLDDSLLYFKSTDTEYFFYTFDLDDFALVDSCGRKGQGPNEWLYPEMTIMSDGERLILDKGAFYRLKGQNITKLAPYRRFENISGLQFLEYPLVGYMYFSPKEVGWKLYDMENMVTKDSVAYKDEGNKGQALQQYDFFWDYAANNKVVMAHLYEDKYTVLHLQNDTIGKKQIYKGDVSFDSNRGELCYGDIECTEKYLFLLSHKRQKEGYLNATEIEVYDYEGNPVALLKLGIAAQHMLVDKVRQRILLLSPSDDFLYIADLNFDF